MESPGLTIPDRIADEKQLEEVITKPSPALAAALSQLDDDLMILGAGGKMGPDLARLAQRGLAAAGSSHKVIAVSRFSRPEERERLETAGITALAADLLEESDLQRLPRVRNVLFLAGTKFGTQGNEHYTWAVNAYLPGRIAQHFSGSRLVVFSTGNVYPLVPVTTGGCREDTSPAPLGEYAQSCLGRERVFAHFSHRCGIPMLFFRLNYAVELRYGILLEVARAVWYGQPLDLTMGQVNVIWQGDALQYALRALFHTASPPCILNVTGPETVSIRSLAEAFARRMNRKPNFSGAEADTALLSNAASAHALFGYPSVALEQMIEWVADWVTNEKPVWGKDTHFQERGGVF